MTYKDYKKKIGELIRKHRVQKGMMLKDLANELDVDYQRIQNYENGKYLPRFYTMYKIVKILGIPPDEIFNDSVSKSRKK